MTTASSTAGSATDTRSSVSGTVMIADDPRCTAMSVSAVVWTVWAAPVDAVTPMAASEASSEEPRHMRIMRLARPCGVRTHFWFWQMLMITRSVGDQGPHATTENLDHAGRRFGGARRGRTRRRAGAPRYGQESRHPRARRVGAVDVQRVAEGHLDPTLRRRQHQLLRI